MSDVTIKTMSWMEILTERGWIDKHPLWCKHCRERVRLVKTCPVYEAFYGECALRETEEVARKNESA